MAAGGAGRELAGYGLAAPSRADALAALVRMFGEDEARTHWNEACEAMGIDPDREPLDLDRLGDVARHLSEQPGLVRVVGATLWVRIRSYRVIRRELANEEGPVDRKSGSEDSTPRDRDHERLEEILELGLLEGGVDEELERLVQQATRELDLPISLVSVVLDEAQSFAASHGLTGWMDETRGTPGEWAFCRYAVDSGEPFVVEDAATHPLVRTNPLVTQEGIRCYAGIPLVTSRGHALGTLCVIGREPRKFGREELARLRELADQAVRRIEERRGRFSPATGPV